MLSTPPKLVILGIKEHLELARELMHTCYQFYQKMPTGLAPEIVALTPLDPSEDFHAEVGAPHNLLRPGTPS